MKISEKFVHWDKQFFTLEDIPLSSRDTYPLSPHCLNQIKFNLTIVNFKTLIQSRKLTTKIFPEHTESSP